MIPSPAISTGRLELVPATLPMLRSDLNHNHAELGRLLNAAIPAAWPPPLLDDEACACFVTLMSEGSDPHFSLWYWVRTGPDGIGRTLIGSGGTVSSERSTDAVMIGYSVLEEFQNRGYASEAIRYLIPTIFADTGIQLIIATTYPELRASIRVLAKNGFVPAGPAGNGDGMEEGTLMYVLERTPG
jgi:ribosomal-protein-alanine N-acetyltransferase